MLASLHHSLRRRTGYTRLPDIEIGDGAVELSTYSGTRRRPSKMGDFHQWPRELFNKTLLELDAPAVEMLRQTSRDMRQAVDETGHKFWTQFADELGPIKAGAQNHVHRHALANIQLTRHQHLGVYAGCAAAVVGVMFLTVPMSYVPQCGQRVAQCTEHIINATLVGLCLQPGRPYPGPGCERWNTTDESAPWRITESAYQSCHFDARKVCNHEKVSGAFDFVYLRVMALLFSTLVVGVFGIPLIEQTARLRARWMPRIVFTPTDPKRLAFARLAEIRKLGGQLAAAVDRNDVTQVRRLTALGFASAARYKGRYPLRVALQNKRFEIADVLIESGAIPRDASLLEMAIRQGAPAKSIRELLRSGFEPTPWLFRYAVTKKRADVAQALCDASRDPAALLRRMSTDTLVRKVIKSNASLDLVRLLLNLGVPAAAQQEGETSALHVAVRESRVELVDVLLQAGANLNACDEQGLRAVDLARANLASFPLNQS